VKLSPALLLYAGIFAAGAGCLYLVLEHGCRKQDGPLIVGRVDTVPDTVLVASRPIIKTRFVDRIIIKTVPAKVTVSEGVPDTALALRYARRALAADSIRRAKQRGDSVARQPGPILPPVAGTYDGKHLSLWLTRSDGSLMRATAKLKPRAWFWSGYDAGSDSLPIFRSDRWYTRWARRTPRCGLRSAPVAGLGALADKENRVRGALISGVAALLSCVTD
jgi:hypothetical protein